MKRYIKPWNYYYRDNISPMHKTRKLLIIVEFKSSLMRPRNYRYDRYDIDMNYDYSLYQGVRIDSIRIDSILSPCLYL